MHCCLPFLTVAIALYSAPSFAGPLTVLRNGGVLELGSSCRSSLACSLFIPHSHCDWQQRVCTCAHYNIPYNNSMCLPASLLTYGCAVDQQCQVKVPNSQCLDGLCRCRPHFVPLRKDKCLPPAKIHDFCLNDQQCHLASRYSYCKYIIPRVYGKCQCPLTYQVTKDRKCMPYLGSSCESSEDCQATTSDSYCQKIDGDKVCSCKEGFKISDNKLRCDPLPKQQLVPVLPVDSEVDLVSLGKRCYRSEQCQARDPNSDCIDGICACVNKNSTCNARHNGCRNDTFQCRNGQCVSWYFVCDKQKNCADGSDEDQCIPHKCPKEAFQCNDGTCLSRATVCNGRWECPDGSDEARCYKGIPCDENAFRCASGQCLPQYVFCNAVTDCLDGSDELESVCDKGTSCPANTFRCDNNRCRSSAILCSGVDGCGDNSDETGCSVCSCEKP